MFPVCRRGALTTTRVKPIRSSALSKLAALTGLKRRRKHSSARTRPTLSSGPSNASKTLRVRGERAGSSYKRTLASRGSEWKSGILFALANRARKHHVKKVMTVKEVSNELGVSEKTVYRLLARGLLKRLGGLRVIRVSRASFDSYIAQGTEVAR